MAPKKETAKMWAAEAFVYIFMEMMFMPDGTRAKDELIAFLGRAPEQVKAQAACLMDESSN